MSNGDAARTRRKIDKTFLREVLRINDADTIANKYGYKRAYAFQLLARARKELTPPTVTARPVAEGAPPKPETNYGMGRLVGRVIESYRGGLNGSGNVKLGALKGLPSMTRDPAVIAQAIEHHRAKLTQHRASPLAELRARQRILDLRAAMASLEGSDQVAEDRAVFVAYGAEWAHNNGLTYEAFRDAGVPANILREAGI